MSMLSVRSATAYTRHASFRTLHRNSVGTSTSLFCKRLELSLFSRGLSTSVDDDVAALELSSNGLGLLQKHVWSCFASIRQLPEVDSALASSANHNQQQDSLERAVQIFGMMQKGGPEHRAVLALLAHFQHQAGAYDKALSTVKEMENFDSSVTFDLTLALAKSKLLWHSGKFPEALNEAQMVADSNSQNIIEEACASNAAGISQLMLLDANVTVDYLSEMEHVKEVLRVAARACENEFLGSPLSLQFGLASAAMYGNLGVANSVYYQTLKDKAPDMPVPIDPSLQACRQGLTLCEQVEASPTFDSKQQIRSAVRTDLIRWRLYHNMASMILLDHKYNEDDEILNKASEFARDALAICEKHVEVKEHKWNLGRTLSLVAECYVRANSAVTAEGLFQSSRDLLKDGVSPLEHIDSRDATLRYADLCNKWEKRQGNAHKLQDEAKEINEKIAADWERKKGCYSGLWFFTLDDFSTTDL